MRQLPESIWYAVEALHCYNLDPVHREIYLVGEESQSQDELAEPGVEYTMANRFIRNLRFLELDSKTKPITVHMKTCGGYWEEGMAIYDAIKLCTAPVTILCYTHARSMSSLIFQAADRRVMMPHSYFMFHDGMYADDGTLKQVETRLNFTKATQTPQMMKVYVDAMQHRGKYMDKNAAQCERILRKEMDKKEDVFLTAEQAIEWGFADEIFDGNWDSFQYAWKPKPLPGE